MPRSFVLSLACSLLFGQLSLIAPVERIEKRGLKIRFGALPITPFGPDRYCDGTMTESAVGGE